MENYDISTSKSQTLRSAIELHPDKQTKNKSKTNLHIVIEFGAP